MYGLSSYSYLVCMYICVCMCVSTHTEKMDLFEGIGLCNCGIWVMKSEFCRTEQPTGNPQARAEAAVHRESLLFFRENSVLFFRSFNRSYEDYPDCQG